MEETNYLKFLGTAGARIVVSRQIRASGGIWISLDGVNILLDPGPGSLVRALKSRPPLQPGNLDAVCLSHMHLDHTGDVNIMIEAMTNGGHNPRGILFTPAEAIRPREPAVYSYVRKFLNRVEVLREGGSYSIGGVAFSTPIRHRHAAETYGFRFETSFGIVSFVTDSSFFPGLVKAYAGSDILVLNVVLYEHPEDSQIQHLALSEAELMIGEIKPRAAILTHMGMSMLRNKPWELAAEMTRKTGVSVFAANDGMMVNLEELVAPVEEPDVLSR